MRTILVIAQHPQLGEAVRSVLDPQAYRTVVRSTLDEAKPMLETGILDACIADLELTDARDDWFLDALTKPLKGCPVLIYSGSRQPEWEEEAYLKGVKHVLSKPVRGRLLNVLLEDLWKKAAPASQPLPPPIITPVVPMPLSRLVEISAGHTQHLHLLREFSAILTHSLQAEPLLREFLSFLRQTLDVNRASIFLRQPLALLTASPAEQGRYLRSACTMGLSPALLEHFQLSFEGGIGGYLYREGRILRRESAADPEAAKEFELLGAQVAIPILDNEKLVGIAALDGRVTGEALTNSELAIVFHLLEGLGLALKNIWLHEQLSANHEMMASILRELSSACVVLSRDLVVLHSNKAARNLFAPQGRRNVELEFNDLPQELGRKMYQVLQTGSAVVPFKFQPVNAPGLVYLVSALPFQRAGSGLPHSALLVVDDQTQAEKLKRLEVETANLRLVRIMAERLAHETNNAVTPLDTYQQLLAKQLEDKKSKEPDPVFLESLSKTLEEAVKRISRRGAQMRLLGLDGLFTNELFDLGPVIEKAFQEAARHHPAPDAKPNFKGIEKNMMFRGDERALALGLSELFLNALQSKTKDLKISVRAQALTNDDGTVCAKLEIQDNGPGFTAEDLKVLNEDKDIIYTKKIIGVGLGVTVARKAIKMHNGTLLFANAAEGEGAITRISLPLEPTPPGKR